MIHSVDNFIELKRRYPNSVPADVTDAFMRGFVTAKEMNTAYRNVKSDGIIGHCNCSSCGTVIDLHDNYCRVCGKLLLDE